jgi:hypothetical protein
MTSSQHVYEIRLRKDHRGVEISWKHPPPPRLPPTQRLWRDLPSWDDGMASKTARQEEGFIGVIGNSQVDGESS